MAQTLEAVFYRGDNQNMQDYTPSGSSPGVGKVLDIGSKIGVVVKAEGLSDGKLGSVATGGVFKLKKSSGGTVNFARGADVFWDTANNTAVAAPGSNIVFAGIADEAAANGDDHVKTEINTLGPQGIQTRIAAVE